MTNSDAETTLAADEIHVDLDDGVFQFTLNRTEIERLLADGLEANGIKVDRDLRHPIVCTWGDSDGTGTIPRPFVVVSAKAEADQLGDITVESALIGLKAITKMGVSLSDLA